MIFKLDSPVPDELGDMYLRLLEKHTKKIKNEYGQDELSKRALKMYIDIICEKKRRKTKMVEL